MRYRLRVSIATLRIALSKSSIHPHCTPSYSRFYSSKKSSDPLRILFCGSDEFSCASLRALNEECLKDPKSIASIDVLCRPGKRTGRHLKTIREVPIKAVAKELGLFIHERDTFTNWNLPNPNGFPINLIVAVSFGLFVPPRILKSAKYGGLNVHPSLLPQHVVSNLYRGPAPLHHTILQGEQYTGVTLQTLDAHKFDHGNIISQTPHPGLLIPEANKITFQKLLEFITPKAASMLTDGIRDREFLDPSRMDQSHHDNKLNHAPKITSNHRYIVPAEILSIDVERQYRALGPLWGLAWEKEGHNKGNKKRIILDGLEVVSLTEDLVTAFDSALETKGHDRKPQVIQESSELIYTPWIAQEDQILVPMEGKLGLRIKWITVEGQKRKDATLAISNFTHPYLGNNYIAWMKRYE